MTQNNFILGLIAGLQKIRSKQQIKADIKALGDIYVKLIGNLDMTKTIKTIRNQIKGANNLSFFMTPTVDTKGVQSATKQTISSAQKIANKNKVKITYSFDMDKKNLQDTLRIFAKENSKLFTNKEMTAKYNQLLNLTNIAKSKSELIELRKQLSAFRTELISTGNAGMTWSDKFKASISHFAQYFSGASFIYALTNQMRNAWTEAKNLDNSLVNLQKVTSEIADRDSLYKYLDRTMSKAQELNVKVGSLIDAITEFKKLGWSLSDAELGGKWANILSNVGDVDIETAIGSIKTAIASFDEIGGYGNDQLDKKLEAYVDLINNMSNKYSIDAQGLSEAIRLSAGTLTEAHTSIEQAAVMFSKANEYFNDPSYLGNTAKIGSLRIRTSKGDTSALKELEEMGEEIDNLSGATSKLREQLLALTGVDIMVDENTFKGYYDQLYEISQVIDQLDDTSRANVLETSFGKSRAAGGAALLNGMKDSAQAYQDAINSAGSATQEYETWMQSADAATQRFSNNLIQTYQQIINGNTVRDLANLGSSLLEFANKFGIIEGALKGILALKVGSFLMNMTMAFLSATKQAEQYGKALQMANNIPNGNLAQRFATLKSIAQATSTLTTAQLKQVLSNKALTQQDRIRILMMQGMSREMGIQKLKELQLTQVTNAQTAANAAQTASTFSLKSAMIGLGNTLRSVFLSNPVGIALMGISVAVSAVTSAVSSHNQKMEEMRQKAKETAEEASTLGDEIAELTSKYIQLSEAVKTDSSVKEDLMSTQTELLKKLGLEGEGIDELTSKYGSLSEAIKQASIDSLKNARIDLLAGVNATKEELLDIGKDGFWGTNNIIDATGDDAVRAFKELEKAGIVSRGSYGTGGGSLSLIGDDTTTEGILENYDLLERGLSALRDSNAFTAEELPDNSLYKAMYARYSEMTEAVDNYRNAISELNENVAQETMLTALQGEEIPKTESEFNTFKQELIDTAIASNQFIGTEKEIADVINNYLATVPQFEGFYSVPLESELNKVDELLNQNRYVFPSLSDLLSQKISEDTDAKSYSELLDAYQSQIKEIYDYLNKIKSGDFTNTDLLDLIQAFPQLGIKAGDSVKTIERKLLSLSKGSLKDALSLIKQLEEGQDNPAILSQLEVIKLSLLDIKDAADESLNSVNGVREELVKKGSSKIDYTDTLNGIEDITNAMKAMSNIYEEYKDADTSVFSLDALKNAEAEFGNLESFKKLMSYLNETGNLADANDEKLQKFFDNILNDYTQMSGILSLVNKDNQKIIADLLTQWGIEKAEEVTLEAQKINEKNELNERAVSVEFQIWKKYLTEKATGNSQVASAIYQQNVETFARLGMLYSQDANNFVKACETKIQAQNELDKLLGDKDEQNWLITDGRTASDYKEYSRLKEQEKIAQKAYDDAEKALDKNAKKEALKKLKNLRNKLEKIQLPDGSSGSGSNKDKSSDSKSQIDWIARKLERLQKIIDATKAKFDNLFTVKSKSSNLDKQFKQTTDLLKANEKAAKSYKSYADKYAKKSGLSKSLIGKIQNGNYSISDYDSDTADKINKYKEYWDLYKDAKQNVDELTTSVRNLKEEKYQLHADDAKAKIDKSQAYAELDAGNYKEQNKHIDYQKKQLKEQYKYLIKIAKLNKDDVEVAKLKAEKQKELNDLTKQQFDNIVNTYDNKTGLTDNKIKAFQNQISLMEAKGQTVGSALYTKQMSLNDGKTDKLLKEKDALIKKLAEIPKGSDTWYDAQDKLFAVDEELVQIQIDNANLQKSINQLKFDRFDDLIAKLNDVVDETDFLIDMLDSDNLFDEKGMITDDGITAMGLTAQNYDMYLAEAEKYKQLQSDIQKMYDENKISLEEYESKMREAKQGERDSIKNYTEMRKACIDYVKQGLDAQIEALEKEIDLKKELLDSEKDLYDFQNKIADQNKNIVDLRKQISALETDDSEENRKKLQQLKAELADAEQEQKDTLYDRSVEDQKNSLDEMLENSKDANEQYLKDSTKVFADSIDYINTHSEQVSQNLEKLSEELGYDISENITDAWKNGGDAVGTYEDILEGNVPKINEQIDAITNKWKEQTLSIEETTEAARKLVTGEYLKNIGSGNDTDNDITKKLVNVSGAIGSSVGITGALSSAIGALDLVIPKFNIPEIKTTIPKANTSSPVYNIDNRITVEGVATDKIVNDFSKLAQKQAENVVAKISGAAYAKGVRKK